MKYLPFSVLGLCVVLANLRRLLEKRVRKLPKMQTIVKGMAARKCLNNSV